MVASFRRRIVSREVSLHPSRPTQASSCHTLAIVSTMACAQPFEKHLSTTHLCLLHCSCRWLRCEGLNLKVLFFMKPLFGKLCTSAAALKNILCCSRALAICLRRQEKNATRLTLQCQAVCHIRQNVASKNSLANCSTAIWTGIGMHSKVLLLTLVAKWQAGIWLIVTVFHRRLLSLSCLFSLHAKFFTLFPMSMSFKHVSACQRACSVISTAISSRIDPGASSGECQR